MELTSCFSEALLLAHALHSDQKRKQSKVPYISHLLGVCAIALEYGANEEEAIAALLHDAVEDQGGADTEKLIRERFGDNVADIVRNCSDTDVTPKPPWRERKERYIAHLQTANASTLLVSASDKLHNCQTILSDFREVGDEVWQRFKGGKDGTLWYYQSLVTAFDNNSHHRPRLVGELNHVVEELVKLANSSIDHEEEYDPLKPIQHYSYHVYPKPPFHVDSADMFHAYEEEGYFRSGTFEDLEEAIAYAAKSTRSEYQRMKDLIEWRWFGEAELVYDANHDLIWSGNQEMEREIEEYFKNKPEKQD